MQIPSLLEHPKPLAQSLGADLLAAYLRAQGLVDHQAPMMEHLMSKVTYLLLGPGGVKAGAAAAGGASRDPGVRAACLGCVDEYVGFCCRLKIFPLIMEDLEACIFLNVDLGSKGQSW